MVLKKGYILVEGHGEVKAAHNLICRLSQEIGLYRLTDLGHRMLKQQDED